VRTVDNAHTQAKMRTRKLDLSWSLLAVSKGAAVDHIIREEKAKGAKR
jgi:hypothetical protein